MTAPTSADNKNANVFDIPLLADRLVDAVRWLEGHQPVAKFPLGLFGASTGAAAALVAAAELPVQLPTKFEGSSVESVGGVGLG